MVVYSVYIFIGIWDCRRIWYIICGTDIIGIQHGHRLTSWVYTSFVLSTQMNTFYKGSNTFQLVGLVDPLTAFNFGLAASRFSIQTWVRKLTMLV